MNRKYTPAEVAEAKQLLDKVASEDADKSVAQNPTPAPSNSALDLHKHIPEAALVRLREAVDANREERKKASFKAAEQPPVHAKKSASDRLALGLMLKGFRKDAACAFSKAKEKKKVNTRVATKKAALAALRNVPEDALIKLAVTMVKRSARVKAPLTLGKRIGKHIDRLTASAGRGLESTGRGAASVAKKVGIKGPAEKLHVDPSLKDLPAKYRLAPDAVAKQKEQSEYARRLGAKVIGGGALGLVGTGGAIAGINALRGGGEEKSANTKLSVAAKALTAGKRIGALIDKIVGYGKSGVETAGRGLEATGRGAASVAKKVGIKGPAEKLHVDPSMAEMPAKIRLHPDVVAAEKDRQAYARRLGALVLGGGALGTGGAIAGAHALRGGDEEPQEEVSKAAALGLMVGYRNNFMPDDCVFEKVAFEIGLEPAFVKLAYIEKNALGALAARVAPWALGLAPMAYDAWQSLSPGTQQALQQAGYSPAAQAAAPAAIPAAGAGSAGAAGLAVPALAAAAGAAGAGGAGGGGGAAGAAAAGAAGAARRKGALSRLAQWLSVNTRRMGRRMGPLGWLGAGALGLMAAPSVLRGASGLADRVTGSGPYAANPVVGPKGGPLAGPPVSLTNMAQMGGLSPAQENFWNNLALQQINRNQQLSTLLQTARGVGAPAPNPYGGGQLPQ